MPNTRVQTIAKLLLAIAGVSTILFFILDLPVVGHDAYSHLTNLDQYITSWHDGVILPRWTPNNFWGLGAATFYFYPPLAAIGGALIHLVLPMISLNYVVNIELLLSTILAGLSFRWYLHHVNASSNFAWWASLAYAVGPYPFFDAVVRTALAEYLCFSWVPLVLIAVEICREDDVKRHSLKAISLASIGWTLLILSNIPITILSILVIGVYILMRNPAHEWYKFWPIVIGGGIAILCDAGNLIPIIEFQHAAQLTRVVSISGYHPFEHFWFFHLLHAHDHRTPDILEAVEFPLTVILSFWTYREYSKNFNMVSGGMFGIACLILAIHLPWLTSFLSKQIEIFSLIQFPSRAYLFAGIVFGYWLSKNSTWQLRTGILLPVLLASISTVCCAGYLWHLEKSMGDYPIEKKINWNIYEYAPAQSPNDIQAVKRMGYSHQNDSEITPVSALAPGDVISLVERTSDESQLQIHLGSTTEVYFHRFYWPTWVLSAGGHKLATYANTDGLLSARLPAGTYSLKVAIVPSSGEKLGGWISLLGVVLMLGITGFGFTKLESVSIDSVSDQEERESPYKPEPFSSTS